MRHVGHLSRIITKLIFALRNYATAPKIRSYQTALYDVKVFIIIIINST